MGIDAYRKPYTTDRLVFLPLKEGFSVRVITFIFSGAYYIRTVRLDCSTRRDFFNSTGISFAFL